MKVDLNNYLVEVKIIRKKIKNIYFRFDNNLNLVVSANRFVSEKEIKRLIEKNRTSLERMLIKTQKKQKKEQEFWYLGVKYEIIFDEKFKEIEFQNGTILCQNEKMLELFLKKQIRRIFQEEVEQYKKIIETPPFHLRIRKMKTRWGVCNYKLNTITLNSELIKYKKEDLRYVIVHEMCHFYHHNHGKSFWNMVNLYYPNYKEARKDLKEV